MLRYGLDITNVGVSNPREESNNCLLKQGIGCICLLTARAKASRAWRTSLPRAGASFMRNSMWRTAALWLATASVTGRGHWGSTHRHNICMYTVTGISLDQFSMWFPNNNRSRLTQWPWLALCAGWDLSFPSWLVRYWGTDSKANQIDLFLKYWTKLFPLLNVVFFCFPFPFPFFFFFSQWIFVVVFLCFNDTIR